MKNCAVVILNYNGVGMLRQFLPSVLEHSNSDIWVIDNASQDGSVELLEKEFPTVSIIKLQENFGYAGGYNWGLEELRGQYRNYILLNSDVEVRPDWDDILVSTLESDELLAAVQPKILSFQNPRLFDYAGAGGGFLDDFYYPYCRGRIWNVIEEDHGQYDDFTYVDWASGACIAVKADLFHQAGGFDAHFFAHMEEIDLCVRLSQQGFKIAYDGRASVLHFGGATLSRSSPRKLFLNIKNSLSMIYKAENSGKFWWIFSIKLLTEWLAAMGYFLKGDRKYSSAIFNAYDEFWKNRNLQKRVLNGEKFERIGPSGWIYWDFIVLRKRSFQKL